MVNGIFSDFLTKFNKKNFEIGKDSNERWYFSLSFFSTLFYVWIDKPNVNESYFTQIVDSFNFIDVAYFTKYVSLFKSKVSVIQKINDKTISADIREFGLGSKKSAYFLVLSKK
jgi:hypothetical protein